MNPSKLFDGRIRPGYYFGGLVFFSVVGYAISYAFLRLLGTTGNIFMLLINLAVLVLNLGLVVRRLHDMNKTGLYALLLFIPIVNLIAGLWILFSSGTKEANQFGPAPTHNKFFAAILNQ